MRIGIILKKNMGIIAAIKLKKHVANTPIPDIVVSKLCYKKEPNLVILPSIDKYIKTSPYCTILSLNLAIYL